MIRAVDDFDQMLATRDGYAAKQDGGYSARTESGCHAETNPLTPSESPSLALYRGAVSGPSSAGAQPKSRSRAAAEMAATAGFFRRRSTVMA